MLATTTSGMRTLRSSGSGCKAWLPASLAGATLSLPWSQLALSRLRAPACSSAPTRIRCYSICNASGRLASTRLHLQCKIMFAMTPQLQILSCGPGSRHTGTRRVCKVNAQAAEAHLR